MNLYPDMNHYILYTYKFDKCWQKYALASVGWHPKKKPAGRS